MLLVDVITIIAMPMIVKVMMVMITIVIMVKMTIVITIRSSQVYLSQTLHVVEPPVCKPDKREKSVYNNYTYIHTCMYT